MFEGRNTRISSTSHLVGNQFNIQVFTLRFQSRSSRISIRNKLQQFSLVNNDRFNRHAWLDIRSTATTLRARFAKNNSKVDNPVQAPEISFRESKNQPLSIYSVRSTDPGCFTGKSFRAKF